MRHRDKIPFLTGACVGFLASAVVLSYGYLESHIHVPAINDSAIFLACPPSILLMAADGGKWYISLFADSLVILLNTLLYAAVAAVVTKLLSKR
jgi:hypothetical protein